MKDSSKKQKRILLVSNMYPSKAHPYYGIFVKNSGDLLKSNNLKVEECVINKINNKLLKLIAYIIFYLKGFFKVLFNNYDYIHVHFISHSVLGIFIPYKIKKTCLVLNVHGNDVVADEQTELKNERKSKFYLQHTDKIIVPSSYFKNELINKYKVDSTKITIHPSGGISNIFKKIDKKTAKKNAGLDINIAYIGYVSRIEKNKGYDTLLKAIYELKKENKLENRKVLFVGSGNERNLFSKLVKELDLQNEVLIKEMVSPKDLVNIYNSLDLFIFPTHRKSESLGLVGLEAMACEVFVIAANNYGPKEYVIDNETGFLFRPKDVIALKNKIIAFDNLTSAKKNEIIKNAKAMSEKYASDNVKNILLNVFR